MADDRGFSAGAVGVIFLIGGLAGAAAALLLAPQSGRESRQQLRRYARRTEENIHEMADRATEALGRAMDAGREVIQEKTSVLSGAFEAGRDNVRQKYGQLTGEKKG
jgi:gas vesicle protein